MRGGRSWRKYLFVFVAKTPALSATFSTNCSVLQRRSGAGIYSVSILRSPRVTRRVLLQDQVVAPRRDLPPQPAKALMARVGISQPVLSRTLGALGDRV